VATEVRSPICVTNRWPSICVPRLVPGDSGLPLAAIRLVTSSGCPATNGLQAVGLSDRRPRNGLLQPAFVWCPLNAGLRLLAFVWCPPNASPGLVAFYGRAKPHLQAIVNGRRVDGQEVCVLGRVAQVMGISRVEVGELGLRELAAAL